MRPVPNRQTLGPQTGVPGRQESKITALEKLGNEQVIKTPEHREQSGTTDQSPDLKWGLVMETKVRPSCLNKTQVGIGPEAK